jgi:Domain of unknown function (DU1801)
MAKNKTTENTLNVSDFLQSITDENKRKDCTSLVELLQAQTGFEAKMWGSAIIGFGSYHYQYDSGRKGDFMLVGFSPRAAAISVYLSEDFEHREELLNRLGKHKADKACIHIKKLADIDIAVFQEMVNKHIERVQELYSKNI